MRVFTGRTHSVDLTISNILEGNVPYMPIQQVPPAQPQQQHLHLESVPSTTVQAKNQPVVSLFTFIVLKGDFKVKTFVL